MGTQEDPVLRSSIYLTIQNLGLFNALLETVLLKIIFALSKSSDLPFILFYLNLIHHNNSALNHSSISMYQITILRAFMLPLKTLILHICY